MVMAERRLYDPYSVREALKGDAPLREELAWTLGRVGDGKGRGVLEELLVDEAAPVRRAAAFALGYLEPDGPPVALLRAAAGADRETAILAVESLAAKGTGVAEVLQALTPLSAEERWARLLPSLHRFEDDNTTLLAAGGLQVEEPELHAAAAFALTHDPAPGSLSLIRGLLGDGEAQVRGWAVGALGEVGEGSDLERLLPFLGDSSVGPVVRALRAAQSLIAAGKSAAPDSWRPRLVALCADKRPAVRLAALRAAGAWLLDPELGKVLVDRARGAQSEGERTAALLALAAADHPRAVELIREAAASARPTLRAVAARGAGLLSDGELLTLLSQDEVGGVRAAAYLASLRAYDRVAGEEDEVLESWARIALADPDSAVRGTVLDWLSQRPILPSHELVAAIEPARRDRIVDTKLSAVSALVARGLEVALERDGVIVELERLARGADYPLRRAAVEALVHFGEPLWSAGSAGPGRGATVYRDLLVAGLPSGTIELQTERGKVRIELRCRRAVLTCLSFLQLTRQGFFDGQLFHRVIPASLVQTGDPRGDGWGGPGYTLRDEPNLLRFRRGVVGMAHSGPDTAGSQFFVTLTRRPELDGRYTAFGEVVEGLAVLDSILPGDRLERVVIVP